MVALHISWEADLIMLLTLSSLVNFGCCSISQLSEAQIHIQAAHSGRATDNQVRFTAKPSTQKWLTCHDCIPAWSSKDLLLLGAQAGLWGESSGRPFCVLCCAALLCTFWLCKHEHSQKMKTNSTCSPHPDCCWQVWQSWRG